MPTGPDLLRAWIARSKLNQREAALRLGFDQTFLSQILNKLRSPGLINAIKIERVTGIVVESWVPIESGKAEGDSPAGAENAEMAGGKAS
jgi:transcriptional regulator with XRE-family HTH domain